MSNKDMGKFLKEVIKIKTEHYELFKLINKQIEYINNINK